MRPWTRRSFVASALAASARAAEREKGRAFPSEWRRFADPSTEFEVFRLTEPGYSSTLPSGYGRTISRRGNFLIFCSDRTGSQQVFRMDLKNGEWRQLTAAQALDPFSPTLLPDERSICFFDGNSLRQLYLSNLREREIYRVPEGWERCPGASVSDDGQYALFGERRNGAARLQLVTTGRGTARTLVETPWILSDPIANPKRAQVLYRQGEEALWLVNFDGKQNRRLKIADGHAGPARWAADGKTILYLNFPEDPKALNTLREYAPDQNSDKLIAKTSQFVQFGVNENSSVFAGASQNKASPYILLLLRVTRRELTVCEHHASDARMVAPRFSHDSQAIYFQSDRHGKPAIYRVRVEKFVEQTDDGPDAR